MKKKLKQILAKTFPAVLAAILLFVLLPPVSANAWRSPPSINPFTDSGNHWGSDAIGWAYINGITTGISETLFAPDRSVSRAEFVTFLWRVDGECPAGRHPFGDVIFGRWYSRPVTWAYTNDITTGISATTFAPRREITREEMAVMLHRYILNATDTVSSDVPDGVLDRFPDGGQASSWALEALRWAVNYEIIGQGTRLNPRGNATRAETVTMLRRVTETFELPARLARQQVGITTFPVIIDNDTAKVTFYGFEYLEWFHFFENRYRTDWAMLFYVENRTDLDIRIGAGGWDSSKMFLIGEQDVRIHGSDVLMQGESGLLALYTSAQAQAVSLPTTLHGSISVSATVPGLSAMNPASLVSTYRLFLRDVVVE